MLLQIEDSKEQLKKGNNYIQEFKNIIFTIRETNSLVHALNCKCEDLEQHQHQEKLVPSSTVSTNNNNEEGKPQSQL